MFQTLKKIVVFTSCILALSSSMVMAQATYRSTDGKKSTTAATPKKTGFDKDRLIYGGGLYGGGGNRSISIGLSPIVGYAITDFWSAGISLGYKYTFVKDYFQVFNYDWQRYESYNLNNNVFVPGVWTRLKVFRNFFTHFEYERVVSAYKYHDNDYLGNYYNERITEGVSCLLLGVGLRQPISERSSFVIYALYDVLQNTPANQYTTSGGIKYSKSPYAGTLDFRAGLNIGF